MQKRTYDLASTAKEKSREKIKGNPKYGGLRKKKADGEKGTPRTWMPESGLDTNGGLSGRREQRNKVKVKRRRPGVKRQTSLSSNRRQAQTGGKKYTSRSVPDRAKKFKKSRGTHEGSAAREIWKRNAEVARIRFVIRLEVSTTTAMGKGKGTLAGGDNV